MTQQSKVRLQLLAYITAIPTVGVVLMWLGNTAFVGRAEFMVDQVRQDVVMDSLRVRAAEDRQYILDGQRTQRRILCYLQAQNHERPYSQCVE